MSGTAGSPNLGITHLAQSQNSAEVTVNSAIDALDNAENAATIVNFASATAVTLTQVQFTGAQMFRCQGLTAASTLTVPTSMRDFNVRNESSWPLTVGGATGATVNVPANETCGLQNDGTDTLLVTSSAGANPGVQFANSTGNVGGVATLLTVSSKFTLTAPSSGAALLDLGTGPGGVAVLGTDGLVPWALLKPEAQNLPLGFVLPGKPASGGVFNLVMAMAVTLPADFAGTAAYAGTVATANAAFTLNHITNTATTAIGTVTFTSAGHTSITLSNQAQVSLAAGDVLQLVAPATQDATLSDIGLTVLAAKV